MGVNYQFVEEDNLLILALYKQETEPNDPNFYYYPVQRKVCLARGPKEKHYFDVSDALAAVLKQYDNIMVTETDVLDPEDFRTYFLDIEVINDPNLELKD